MRISDWSSDVCSSDLFEYQAASWDKPRRVIAKIEWHPGELFPKVGFIVTNLPMEPDWVVRFYNQRGTAEQHIKEGKYAFRWTRLSCRTFRHNRSEEHTSELQSLMRISYPVFCLNKKQHQTT